MSENNMANTTLRLAIGATICAVLLALTVQITEKPIVKNAQMAVEKAVFAVFPKTAKYEEFSVNGDTLRATNEKTPKDADRIYATYADDGTLSGVTFKAKARGYADDVVVMYGYNPEKECITGYKVLKSSETPGFGSKISTDAKFLSGFACLDTRLNTEKTGLLHRIKMTAFGKKSHEWEFDGISGATITSRAVEKMITESTEKIIPVIVKNISVLENGKR